MKAVLHLTTKCNLRCKYCYAPQTGRATMTKEIAEQGVDLAIELGTDSACVSYFGGEPMLRFDLIKELTSYARKAGAARGRQMHFRMSTNGTLFDEESLAFCRDNDILFAISLDGDQEAHDAQRVFADGRGSFETIDEKLDLILKYNPITVFTSVITPAPAGRLAPSIEYMWGRGIRFIAHQVDYTHPDWSPERFEELAQSYRALARFYVDKARDGEHFHLTMIDEKLRTHAKSPIALGETCDFGTRKVSVHPDGRIFPCVQFVSDKAGSEDFCIGHVATGLTQRRDELVAENKSTRPQCEGCALLGRCANWCGCMNWQLTGEITTVPGILCAHERMLIPIVDEVGNTLWAERNRKFLEKHYKEYREAFPYSFD